VTNAGAVVGFGSSYYADAWKTLEPLEIEEAFSSYFSDEAKFPKGSVEFDCALLMRNLGHEWHDAEHLYV
jgi:hypothetical protein